MDLPLFSQDEYRLPEGMKLIGYDSDSERYYFRDTDGSLWVGSPGSEFGQMTRGEFTAPHWLPRWKHATKIATHTTSPPYSQ